MSIKRTRVPLCSLLSLIFGWIWLHVLSQPDTHITTHYTLGVWAICISCILTMCVEPLFLVSKAFLFIKLQVVIETLYVTVRTVIFTCLVLWKPSAAVVAFSVAQISSQIFYNFAYCYYFYHYIEKRKTTPDVSPDDFPFKSLRDFLPKILTDQPPVDWKLSMLTWSFLKQGLLKQILTEGERYVMTLFAVLTFHEQGIYDVVNNLGSLAARLIFRPIEESAYFYFSQLIHRDKEIKDQNKAQMDEAATVLTQLLKCIISFGIIVVCFGQSYSKLLLLFYGGSSLAESLATLLLRTHCFSILLLGINGTTECYALATMNSTQIDRYNHVMAYLSIGFLLVSWILTTLFGSIGFIIANCCNMAARITHSVMFIKKRYSGTEYNPLHGIIPGKVFLTLVSCSGLLTLMSEYVYYDTSKTTHLGVGTILFAATVLIWFYEELEVVRFGYQQYRRQSIKVD